MNRHTFWMFALGLVIGLPSLSLAQNRGNGGAPDFSRFREQMMTELKTQLGAKDDEWAVLQPKIEKVMTLERDAASARMSMFRGGGGNRGGGADRTATDRPSRAGDQPTSAVSTAARELRTALENKEATPEQIASKLTALREARTKAKADLEAARKELQSVLTPRQEAVLVSAGTLE